MDEPSLRAPGCSTGATYSQDGVYDKDNEHYTTNSYGFICEWDSINEDVASATRGPNYFAETVSGYRVIVDDKAALLSSSEARDIFSRAKDVSKRARFNIMIVTVKDKVGKTDESFADDYYDVVCDRGGFPDDGILFLIDIKNRTYYISTCGRAIAVFPDDELHNIFFDDMYDDLHNERFYPVMELLLERIQELGS